MIPLLLGLFRGDLPNNEFTQFFIRSRECEIERKTELVFLISARHDGDIRTRGFVYTTWKKADIDTGND
jgi:hypothetical protein